MYYPRPGSEMAIYFSTLAHINAVINGYGCGVAFIGDRGLGKGDISKITRNPFEKWTNGFQKNYALVDVDYLTSYFVVKYIKKFGLDGHNLEFVLDDVSQIIDTRYYTIAAMNTLCELISDKKLGQGTQDVFNDPRGQGLDVKSEKDLTAHVSSTQVTLALPNKILDRLKKYYGWENMWMSRILCFFPIHKMADYQRRKYYINFNPDMPRVPWTDLRENLLNILPRNYPLKLLPLSSEVKSDKDTYFFTHDRLWGWLRDENRTSNYYNGFLSANALINGRSEITPTDITTIGLFWPNIILGAYPCAYQRIVQAIPKCPNVNRLAQELGYNSRKYIYQVLDSVPFGNSLAYCEDNIVNLIPAFSAVLDRQSEFIKGCL